MIKNKFFIGQRVKSNTNHVFAIERISLVDDEIKYSAYHLPKFYCEDDLEPLPEKKKIVLWQWIVKYNNHFYYENWGGKDLYVVCDTNIRTGATKEVEI